MPKSSYRRKRKIGAGNEGRSMSVTSMAFNDGGPTATSSPTSSHDHLPTVDSDVVAKLQQEVNKKVQDVEALYEEFVKNIDRAGRLLKLKLGMQTMTAVVEVWSSSEGTYNADKRKVLADITVNSDVTNGADKPRRGRPRARASSVPRKKTESQNEGEESMFKKPSAVKRGPRKVRSSSESLCTPANVRSTRSGMRNIATVTPGPNINRPVSVLRRPTPGEMAISLSGSPLLVSTDTTSSMAHINVPLDSDKVISIFPRDGFSTEDMPHLDENTKRQLNMLQDYLKKMCKK